MRSLTIHQKHTRIKIIHPTPWYQVFRPSTSLHILIHDYLHPPHPSAPFHYEYISYWKINTLTSTSKILSSSWCLPPLPLSQESSRHPAERQTPMIPYTTPSSHTLKTYPSLVHLTIHTSPHNTLQKRSNTDIKDHQHTEYVANENNL